MLRPPLPLLREDGCIQAERRPASQETICGVHSYLRSPLRYLALSEHLTPLSDAFQAYQSRAHSHR